MSVLFVGARYRSAILDWKVACSKYPPLADTCKPLAANIHPLLTLEARTIAVLIIYIRFAGTPFCVKAYTLH